MSNNRQPTSGFAEFVAEMKRRHVVRFALGYAAVAFVLLQLAEIVFPAFGVGETGLRYLVIAVALFFPPAVVLAWLYDVTSEGIKRTENLEADGIRRSGGRLPQIAFLVVTALTVGGVALWAGRIERGVELGSSSSRDRAEGPGPVELVAYDPTEPIRSLAVLPLDNFSGSDEQDYFTAGMHEELIAQLSQIAGLRVVSRTSMMRYAGGGTPIPTIGRELRVDGVIEGSVRREGDQVRITVQLIHAASETHVWTQQYDRAVSDVLALQSEVALDIAEQVRAELSPEESSMLTRTASREVTPEAQDAYLRGRFELEKGTQEGYHTAMEHFEEALSEDTSFAPAMAGLASARFLLGMMAPEPAEGEIRLAEEEARRALEMDSMSVEARDVFTLIRTAIPGTGAVFGRDETPEAPDAPQTSVQVRGIYAVGDSAWATAMTQLGRRIEEQVRVSTMRAESAGREGLVFAARQLLAAGRFEDAFDLAEDVTEEDPSNVPAWEIMARAALAEGDLDDVVDVVQEWSESGGGDAPSEASVEELETRVDAEGAVAFWRWMLQRMDARAAAGRPVPPSERAAALVGIGAHDRAFTALEQALAERDPGLASLRGDPVWDPIRSDPRFVEVARRARGLHRAPPIPRRPR